MYIHIAKIHYQCPMDFGFGDEDIELVHVAAYSSMKLAKEGVGKVINANRWCDVWIEGAEDLYAELNDDGMFGEFNVTHVSITRITIDDPYGAESPLNEYKQLADVAVWREELD